jgi:hypothetical protein
MKMGALEMSAMITSVEARIALSYIKAETSSKVVLLVVRQHLIPIGLQCLSFGHAVLTMRDITSPVWASLPRERSDV